MILRSRILASNRYPVVLLHIRNLVADLQRCFVQFFLDLILNIHKLIVTYEIIDRIIIVPKAAGCVR